MNMRSADNHAKVLLWISLGQLLSLLEMAGAIGYTAGMTSKEQGMAIKAVIFDMDGLLFDTETLGVKACQQAGLLQNLDVSEELILSTLGMTTERSSEAYLTAHPSLDLDRYWDDYRQIMLDYAGASGPPLMPYAQQLLDWLDEEGLAIGLCSANQPRLVFAYLEGAGLTERFQAIVHGRPDLPSKPAPDMFLLTAQLLDVAPGDCLVLEDSPNGVKAGRAAGMMVAMVPDMIPFSEELRPYCDLVLDDLSQVPAIVKGG